MAEIRLQEYTAKIKELIRHDQHDEAIAHCQHILRHYPRHIETYYLLGEACLEKRMVREAIEFFQRTLSADPENFLARVGLGIVYDEQDALLEAIWQMERAFELMPGNNEVRRELQRLYAQRDGVEKTRLKLTRGALGRLYSRNGLYEQAISEFHAILRQDPELPDIQLALIEALWREGRRLEAVEICLELLQALPNCLKANLILGVIWTQGGHEDAGVEKLEVARSLDPENLMAQDLFGNDSPLPPEEVWLDELEPTPAELGLVPFGVDQERAVVAPWDMAAADRTQEAEEGTEPDAGWGSGEEVPDWLRDMGLVAEEEGEEKGEAPPHREAAPEPTAGEAMPAWLQELMGEEAEAGPVPEGDRGGPPALPDWLEELEGAVPGEPAPLPGIGLAAGTAAWLVEPPGEEAESAVAPGEEEAELPEWLQELGVPRRGAPLAEGLPGREELEDVPDWLRDLRAGHEAAGEPEGLEEERDLPAAQAAEPTAAEIPAPEAESAPPAGEEVPDWLLALGVVETRSEAEEVIEEQQSLLLELDEETAAAPPVAEEEAETPEGEEIPDWLQALTEPPAEVRAPGAGEEIVTPVIDEIPDWLRALGEAPVPAAEEELEVPKAEEVPAWLEELGAPEVEPPALEAEVPEAPEPEEVPAWPDALAVEAEEAPEVRVVEERAAPAAPAAEIPESLRALVEAGILAEEDLAEAMAGMSPEDLEAQHAEAVPEWLQDLLGEGEVEVRTPAAGEAVEEPVAEEAPAWPEGLGEPVAEPEQAPEFPMAEEVPAWPEGLGEPVAEAPAPEPEQVPEFPMAEEVPAWLEGLGEPVAEAPAPEPEQVPEVWVAEEVPAWLEGLVEPVAEAPAPEPEQAPEVPMAEEVPAWLEGLGEPVAEAPAPEPEQVPEVRVAEEVPPPAEPVAAQAVPEIPPVPAPVAAEAEALPTAGQRFQELRDELQARPRNHPLRLEVARMCAGQKEWNSALGHYEKLIAARKFLPDVLQDLLRLADEDVNRARVYQLLGDVYMQEDQLDRALEMYRHSRQALLKR